MEYGYKLSAEGFGPNELVRQAMLAEASGFDFVEISDHYHPWLDVAGPLRRSPGPCSGRSPRSTDAIGLATGVTCPTVRYHPAIVAQAAATLALVSDGRFTLGIGVRRAAQRARRRARLPRRRRAPGDAARGARDHPAALAGRLPVVSRASTSTSRTPACSTCPTSCPSSPWPRAVRMPRSWRPNSATACSAPSRRPSCSRPTTAPAATGPTYGEVRPRLGAKTEEAAVQAAFEIEPLVAHGLEGHERAAEPGELRGGIAVGARRRTSPQADAVRAGCREAPRGDPRVRARCGFDHVVLTNNGPDPDGFMDFFAQGAEAAALTPER